MPGRIKTSHTLSAKGGLMGKQVYVNKIKCKGCGSCEEISPQAFEMDQGFEKADFIGDGGKIDEKVLEKAASICPAKCIEFVRVLPSAGLPGEIP